MWIVGDVKSHCFSSAISSPGCIGLRLCVLANEAWSQWSVHEQPVQPTAVTSFIAMRHQAEAVVCFLQEPKLLVKKARIVNHHIVFQIGEQISPVTGVDQMVTAGQGKLTWIIKVNIDDPHPSTETRTRDPGPTLLTPTRTRTRALTRTLTLTLTLTLSR